MAKDARGAPIGNARAAARLRRLAGQLREIGRTPTSTKRARKTFLTALDTAERYARRLLTADQGRRRLRLRIPKLYRRQPLPPASPSSIQMVQILIRRIRAQRQAIKRQTAWPRAIVATPTTIPAATREGSPALAPSWQAATPSLPVTPSSAYQDMRD
ncbi:MAG: hypothetical protein IVW57_17465 [Ktedonobacterales bacterium]|nr:hypothetical protein [Ktedonobacterales bacterium]